MRALPIYVFGLIAGVLGGCNAPRVISSPVRGDRIVRVVEIEKESGDWMTWDPSVPVWRVTFSEETESPEPKIVTARYQKLPKFGQFYVGQRIRVGADVFDRWLAQGIMNILDWGDSLEVIERDEPVATAQRGPPSVFGRFTGIRKFVFARLAWLI